MRDTIIQIDSMVLEHAYKKALLYATRKLQKFHSSGLLSKVNAYDVTHEAIEKTLNNKRPWDPTKTPDLFVHLAGCISSAISNAYTSADFQVSQKRDNPEEQISKHHNPESELEFNSKINFILDYLVSARSDIEDVANLVMKNGITEPLDIANQLGISVSEVNSKKIAIKRMLKRTEFLLYYISTNREDLAAISLAIYRDKITNTDDLSGRLKIAPDEVKSMKNELDSLTAELHKGAI